MKRTVRCQFQRLQVTVTGTLEYRAPEIANHWGYSSKVDIWGLGITAIELFQMSPPLAETKSVFQVMMRIVNGPPPQLQRVMKVARVVFGQ